MNRLAVLGHPVAHSLSPRMHAAAFAAVGIAAEWSYEAIDLSPEDLERGLKRMVAERWLGANVTIPHKPAALALADQATERARAIGAANTLSFTAAGIDADNTDAPGLIAAVGADRIDGRSALILGAGGAARAAVWALKRAGARVLIWNRTLEHASSLAEEMGVQVQADPGQIDPAGFDLLVNATAVGLESPNQEWSGGEPPRLSLLPVLADALGERHVVVDLAYAKNETELVELARERGARVVDGLEILVRQGAESFRIWTGLEPPIEAMREAMRSRG